MRVDSIGVDVSADVDKSQRHGHFQNRLKYHPHVSIATSQKLLKDVAAVLVTEQVSNMHAIHPSGKLI